VTARGFYAQTVRTYWRRAGYLLILGAAVFVPLGLLDSVVDRASEIHAEDFDTLSDLGAIALLGGFLAQVGTTLLGDVFYAGAVALALSGGDGARLPPLGTVARKLAYGRLIAVDIIFGVGAAIGVLLLVVPGVIFFTWFALAGPVVELEGAGVRRAFSRSRQLVRGRFWTVLLVLLPITLVSEAASAGLLQVIHDAIDTPILGDWVAEAVPNILLSPFYAVAAVLMTMSFSRAEPQTDVQESACFSVR
jgi:hypothetical protein